jgi:hypothetical protein
MRSTVLKFQNLKRAKIYLIWSLLCRSRPRRAFAHVIIPHRSAYYAFRRDIY